MKIRSHLLTRWISWFIVCASELLFRSCKLVFLAPEPWLQLNYLAEPEESQYGVMCVWHDMLIIPTIGCPTEMRERTCCLVSKHQDGSYLAEAMDFLGYTTVRGSTKRGGAGALKQLLADTAGKHIVITPDGPRGPRRQLKPGAVFVASQTGRPICPGAFACSSAWRIPGSWTDMVVPKPFSTVYLVTGTPMYVPPDLTREQLAQSVAQMQDAMDRLSDQAERLARGEIDTIVFDPPAETSARAAA